MRNSRVLGVEKAYLQYFVAGDARKCTNLAKPPLDLTSCTALIPPMRNQLEALRHGLAEYLGPLSDVVKNKQIVVAACFSQPIQLCANACVHDPCKTFQITKTSPPSIDSITPAIDTHTGRKVEIPKECIKQESPHDNFYLMQSIKIGGSTALLFYDRGSNCHLIDGDLAEREGLEVVSDKPTTIRVAGSNTIVTEYGKYRFRIGPTREGLYHTLTCQGIGRVTSEFTQYSMSEIIKECRSIPGFENEVFPPTVGGGPGQALNWYRRPRLGA